MMNKKKAALGRGLEAILRSPDTDITSKDISGNYVVGAIAEIEISKIETNPFQPRDKFDEDSLRELSHSIAEQGIIQPLTVRKMGFDKYQLISGERRFRASQLADLDTVPCFIRVANDEQMLEWALVENIQRENLNAIEIAISYNRLIEEINLTQDELSKKVGKNRTTVTNYLRLLKLPAQIQSALADDKITMGHARALINIENENEQLNVLNRIINDGLSVRDTEKIVKDVKNITEKRPNKKQKVATSKTHENSQKSLENKLDRKVKMQVYSNGKGKIVIPFLSENDLVEIMKKLQID